MPAHRRGGLGLTPDQLQSVVAGTEGMSASSWQEICSGRNAGRCSFISYRGLMPKVFPATLFRSSSGKIHASQPFRQKARRSLRTSHQDTVLLCPGNHLGFLKSQRQEGPYLVDREQIRADRHFPAQQGGAGCFKMMANEAIGWYHTPSRKVHIHQSRL